MTLLLNFYVCDICDPPTNSVSINSKTYDLKDVKLSINGTEIKGFDPSAITWNQSALPHPEFGLEYPRCPTCNNVATGVNSRPPLDTTCFAGHHWNHYWKSGERIASGLHSKNTLKIDCEFDGNNKTWRYINPPKKP